jgi:hypothetical protein
VLDGVVDAVVPVPALDDCRDLPGIRVLGDVRVGVARGDEHADGLLAVVPDLMPSLGAARKWNDVALGELAVTVVQADGRAPSEDDQELLGAVVEVIDEL